MNGSQVKTKQRVTDHGEVFTAEREVNAMLDLVKHETNRIESRFLEPACGDGNFLAVILRRKLDEVKRKYRKSPSGYEKNAVLAATSIYGVDILQDNVDACQARMFEIWDKEYRLVCKKEVNEGCRAAVRFIFSRNIVCGNALTLKKVDANGIDTAEPIVFSEWAFVKESEMRRKDFTFDKLMEGPEGKKPLFTHGTSAKNRTKARQLPLDGGGQVQPDEEGEFLKEYTSHYRRVQENG